MRFINPISLVPTSPSLHTFLLQKGKKLPLSVLKYHKNKKSQKIYLNNIFESIKAKEMKQQAQSERKRKKFMVTFLVKILLYFLSKIYKSCGKKRADSLFFLLFFLSFKFILKKSHGNSCNLFESLVVSLCHEKILCISLHTQRRKKTLD